MDVPGLRWGLIVDAREAPAHRHHLAFAVRRMMKAGRIGVLTTNSSGLQTTSGCEKGVNLPHMSDERFQVGKGAGRREFTREIGDATLISLAAASRAADDARRAAEQGEDPDAAKVRAGTFDELFTRWLDGYA